MNHSNYHGRPTTKNTRKLRQSICSHVSHQADRIQPRFPSVYRKSICCRTSCLGTSEYFVLTRKHGKIQFHKSSGGINFLQKTS